MIGGGFCSVYVSFWSGLLWWDKRCRSLSLSCVLRKRLVSHRWKGDTSERIDSTVAIVVVDMYGYCAARMMMYLILYILCTDLRRASTWPCTQYTVYHVYSMRLARGRRAKRIDVRQGWHSYGHQGGQGGRHGVDKR